MPGLATIGGEKSPEIDRAGKKGITDRSDAFNTIADKKRIRRAP